MSILSILLLLVTQSLGVTHIIVYCNHTLANDTFVCNGNGYCVNTDECVCKEGYVGDYCETATFNCYGYDVDNINVCSGNGLCVGQHKCQCNELFGGFKCEYPVCNGEYSPFRGKVCSWNGECKNGKCECLKNYYGLKCEFWYCFGIRNDNDSVCGGASLGRCMKHDYCDCHYNAYAYKKFNNDSTYSIKCKKKAHEYIWFIDLENEVFFYTVVSLVIVFFFYMVAILLIIGVVFYENGRKRKLKLRNVELIARNNENEDNSEVVYSSGKNETDSESSESYDISDSSKSESIDEEEGEEEESVEKEKTMAIFGESEDEMRVFCEPIPKFISDKSALNVKKEEEEEEEEEKNEVVLFVNEKEEEERIEVGNSVIQNGEIVKFDPTNEPLSLKYESDVNY